MLNRLLNKIKINRILASGVFSWKGGDLHFPRSSAVASSVLHNGVWEKDLVRLLEASAKPNSFILDIGANIGVSAIEVLSRESAAKVISFEPSPTVLPYLNKTRERSSFKNRWIICEMAVTASHGEDITCAVQAAPGGDVYEGLVDTGRGGKTKKVIVQTTSIDHEWNNAGRPDVSVIKIDVEGAEMGVLKGATECVRFNRPTIITEWCDKNFKAYGMDGTEVFDWCEQSGYNAFVIPELYTIDKHSPALKWQLATHENLLLVPTGASQ